MRRIVTLLVLGTSVAVKAHLIPAQMGTLRLVDDKAYVAMGIPSSALFQPDELIGDVVTAETYGAQQFEIRSRVKAAMGLQCHANPLALLDLRLQPEAHFQQDRTWITQVTAILIFAAPDEACRLRFSTSIYGPPDVSVIYAMRVTMSDEPAQHFELRRSKPFFEVVF